jgi:hypothetical protein
VIPGVVTAALGVKVISGEPETEVPEPDISRSVPVRPVITIPPPASASRTQVFVA